WDAQQYTGTGEFYLDYGHFRYSVTLPAGYIVGGTGTLVNPEDVLTRAERDALRRAATSSDVVHVVSADGFGPGRATAGAAGSTLTWTFDADSVRDVAFSFGDHYLWDATSAVVDSATGRRAAVHVFYRQGAPLFDRVWQMAQSALETFSSRMVPYPYPQLTETEGGSGGMEYPMTVFVQAIPDLYTEDMVTAHEIGHEWFPMLVGSNETRYGWQDEGLNTFDTFFATDAFLPDSMLRHGLDESQAEYLSFIRNADEDLQVMSPANAFGVLNSGYSVEAYAKPGVALWALRSILGPDTFDRAYRTYIGHWAYRHPTPYDFFNTMSTETGQDLDAFFVPWFFSRGRLDQAVTAVAQSTGRVTVTVENRGQLYAPIDVTAMLDDGRIVHWREPMSVWYDGRRRTTTSHDIDGRVTRITLDAVHDFPDVDRANNVKAMM
ncbi:MAG: M1 family aminopeptidase, partial [Gemmatimonadota bacterium]